MSGILQQRTADETQQLIRTQESQMFQKLRDKEWDQRSTVSRLRNRTEEERQQNPDLLLRDREYSSLSKKEKESAKNRYEAAKARNSFVQVNDMESPLMRDILTKEVTIGTQKKTQAQLFDEVKRGDCSQMQNLDPLLRNRAATLFLQEHEQEFQGEPGEVLDRIKAMEDPISQMLNPLRRLAISLVMNNPNTIPEVRDKYRKIDELFNQEIMVATICKQRGQAHGDMAAGITQEDWAQNTQSQKFMFKTMLACHLGRLKCNAGSTSKDWEGSVANAFAHCSRVMITLPAEKSGHYSYSKQNEMHDSYHRKAGFFRRGGATHTLSRKRKGGGITTEKKFFSPRSQYGMNVAIGGLGNYGIPQGAMKRQLKNDGTCGHIFMHFEEGTMFKHSAMLVGFESDAYGKMNQTGHVHDLKATGEFASSFGGQRCDEIGDKYGGRTVDLSGCSTTLYTQAMKLVDKAFDYFATNRELTRNGKTITLESLTRKVCGELGSDDSKLLDIISDLATIPDLTTQTVTAINPQSFLQQFRTQD